MRKQLLNLKFLLMLCMFFCIGGRSVAFAGEEKISLGNGTYSDQQIVWEGTSCTITQSKGNSTTPPNPNYKSEPRWYANNVISFSAKENYTLSSVTVVATTTSYATALKNSTYSDGASASVSSSTVTITTNGDFTITMGAQSRISSITVTTKSTSPTLNSTESSLSFDNVETGSDKDLIFKLTGSNLTADAALSITGDNADMFSVSPSSVSHTEGTISETTITVNYKPTSTGDHAAMLNITSGEDASATVALSGKGIALYTVSWKVNGADYNEGNPSTDVIDGSKVTSLPTPPSSISGKVFVGWTDEEISKSQDNAPLVLFNTAPSAPAVTANTTYYAVFASLSEGAPVETLSQTLAYDTWTYKGSTTGKKSYRLFHTDSYIESAEFDLSTLSKVVVYGGTFGGDKYNKLNIGDGTNTWKDVTVSGKSETGVNTYTGGTALSGTGKLRITSKSGTASGNGSGVRISKVEIYNTQCGYTYSGYATTINTATLTGISVLGDAADLWTGDDFTHDGIIVTATYDDGSEKEVTNSCTYSGYDMSTAGSQTVTVSYGEKPETASYTVTVNTIGNTKETAYTATEAIALIDAGKGLKTPVYVKGKVSEIVTPFSSQYGNISFNVSEDGTTEGDQFQFFRNIKGADTEKYTSEDECPKVGDEVIGYGTLTKYNTTYEFSAGNYLVEKTVSTAPSSNLTLSQTIGEVNVDKTLDIHSYVSTADGYTGTVTYAVTEGKENARVSEAGVITGLAVGTATVKVTAPAIGGSFSESSAEFTVTVVENRTPTTVTFGSEVDDKTFNVNLGETFEGKTATVSPTEAGNVTYSSDNVDVASVDENGAITLGGIAGTATITAFFAATDDYKASSAKYYINVIDPNGPVFYESFDLNDGTGGNDGKWSDFTTTSTLKYDNSGWSVVKESGAYKCARFGTIKYLGSATTPTIDLSGDKYILTFKAGAWNAKDEKTTINVVISNGTLTYNGTSSSTQTIEMNKADWTDYTMTIAGATKSTTIKFTAKVNSDNRFFLDEVKIVKAQAPATSTLSLVAVDNNIYYATFSSSEDVIFPSDVEVDAVSVEGSTLNITELAKDDYFVKATSADGYDVVFNGYYVPANTGVLIKSLKNSVTYYYPYEAATVSLPANQLKPAPAEDGVFTPEPGDHWYYKLAYNNYDTKTGLGFYWGAAEGGKFSVKAGTAYLAVPSTSETNNVKGFCFDGTSTGVSAVDAEEPSKTRVIYNIAGQKVNAMTKAGLYIVNGKKIVIRK